MSSRNLISKGGAQRQQQHQYGHIERNASITITIETTRNTHRKIPLAHLSNKSSMAQWHTPETINGANRILLINIISGFLLILVVVQNSNIDRVLVSGQRLMYQRQQQQQQQQQALYYQPLNGYGSPRSYRSLGSSNSPDHSQHEQQHQRATRYAPPQTSLPRLMQQQPTPVQLPPPPPQPTTLLTGGFDPAQRQLIMPYDGYTLTNGTISESTSSNVIENRRFVEAVNSRCWSSTQLEDPKSVEPSFIIIRPKSEVRINATASIQTIQMAGFDPTKMTRILIHGFTQSYPNTAWLRRTRALFERHSVINNQNLIIMDWGSSAQGSYAQVAGMVSGMGSFLANFLMKLLEMGQDRSKVHLIGHSLGAHLAGFAGKRIKPRVGRITALDPAGPCFGKFFSNSPQDRLGPSDAYEVDVYHYDDSFLGLPGQHGHFDIYVNGGSSQPGCANNANAMLQALITVIFRRDRVLSESHTRSTEVSSCAFENTNCQQVAYECRDYVSFTRGECGKCDDLNGQCFLMGFDYQYPSIGIGNDEQPLRTSNPGKRLFITTGPTEVYCQHHYQILVKFEPSPEMALASKRNRWRLHLDLLTERQERLNVTLSNQMASNVYSYLLLTQTTKPFRFTGAQLQVLGSDGNQVKMQPATSSRGSPKGPKASTAAAATAGLQQQTFWPFGIEINFMSNIQPDIRRVLSSRLCPMAPSSFMSNQIADSTAPADRQAPPTTSWLQFDECLPPPPPVGR